MTGLLNSKGSVVAKVVYGPWADGESPREAAVSDVKAGVAHARAYNRLTGREVSVYGEDGALVLHKTALHNLRKITHTAYHGSWRGLQFSTAVAERNVKIASHRYWRKREARKAPTS